MRNSSTNTSLSSLPKITSKFIEDLIRERKKPGNLAKDYSRKTDKRLDSKILQQRSLRLTQSLCRPEKHEFSPQYTSQHLDIRSPFYKRISVKKVAQCKCRCALKSGELPSISKAHCQYHNDIVIQKKYNLKKFQQSLIANMKDEIQKFHQIIDKNQTAYIESSIEKSAKIKQEKAVLWEINKSQIEAKIAKTLKQAHQQKNLKKTLLKERLEKMYSLDDQNEPFQKILQQRDRWSSKRGKWLKKLTAHMQEKMLQVNQEKQDAEKKNQTKKLHHQIQEQKLLKDLEKCIGVILKSVGSISDLLPKFQNKDIRDRIDQIFIQNLNVQAPHYLKKLKKKLGSIVEEICAQKSDEKDNFKKSNTKFQLNKSKGNHQSPSQKHKKNVSNVSPDSNVLQKQKELFHTFSSEQNSQMKASQILQSLSLIQSIPSMGQSERFGEKNLSISKSLSKTHQKASLLSGKQTISKKKLSSLSKASFASDPSKRNSTFSVKRRESINKQIEVPALSKTFSCGTNEKQGQKQTQKQTQKQNKKPISDCSQNAVLILAKKPLNSSYHITPLTSKQVICEREEFLISDDEDEDEYEIQKRIRGILAARQLREQENEIEKNRIDGMVNLYKQKIFGKRQDKDESLIPQKYRSVKYEQFCSQNTFLYIVSMADNFQGAKKFKFICNQLRLKKRILDDKFMEDVTRQFSNMFENEQEVNEWKEYILQWRGKVMLERLNKMIDVGMLEIKKGRDEMEVEEEKKPDVRESVRYDEGKEDLKQKENEEQNSDCSEPYQEPEEIAIFKQLDQSQLAFQRYLQRLMRKNKHRTYRPLQQISTNNTPPAKSNNQQIISQKTIDQNLETNSTKTIRYTIVDHNPSKQNNNDGMFEGLTSISGIDLSNRKKVMEYLLRKKPNEFRLLNKNIAEVVQLFGGERSQMLSTKENDEKNCKSLESTIA